MTELQISTMLAACKHYPGWFRARRNGERVTLASLYRAGLLRRRARRGKEGAADAAYEYSPTEGFLELAREEGLL